MGELTSLSAVEMAAGIQRRKFSPVDLVEAHLSRIDHLNPRLNAFVTVDREGARKAAKDAEAALERGETLGVLHGVPLTIKSSIDVAGYRCEAGTPLRAGNTPTADAPVVSRLRAAGAILLGNTNAPEFLMAYETDNPLYGRTNNPWDLERTPGGSSGGEAAAIAARCSAGGMGSDGGGSIRIPAHFSGICGLKPTPGRIPATGHFPPSAGPFAALGVVGPMARTIGDLSLLFEVLAGPDSGDSNSAPVPVRWPGEAELRRMNVAYFEDDGRVSVTPETRAAGPAAGAGPQEQQIEDEPVRPPRPQEPRRPWVRLLRPAGGPRLGPVAPERRHQLTIGSLALVLVAVLAASGGQLLLKHGMQLATARVRGSGGSLVVAAATSPWVLLGLTVFAFSAVVWLAALSRVPLSLAYPFNAVSYLVILTASVLVLHERANLVTWAGTVLVVSGLLMVVLSKP